MFFRNSSLIIIAALLPASPAILLAQQSPTSRPVLEEINREMQSVYHDVGKTVVRAELPTPQMAIDPRSPEAQILRNLDPNSLRQLQDIASHARENQLVRIEIRPSGPSTQPVNVSMQPGEAPQPQPRVSGTIILKVAGFSPNSIGVIVDDDQHLVLPHYVDPGLFSGPIRVELDGKITTATFVGSDEKSNLTVLKLKETKGVAASLTDSQPPEPGSLMMALSLNPGLNRPLIWQGTAPDPAVLVNIDGRVAGFATEGRFIPAIAYMPIVDEFVKFGQVRRAMLGIVVDEIEGVDPQRAADPILGEGHFLRVDQVLPNYPADLAGFKVGDVILRLNGHAIDDRYLFSAYLVKQHGKTPMLLLRDHQQIPVVVDLPEADPAQ